MKRWIKRLALMVAVTLVSIPLFIAGLYVFLARADGEIVSSGETRRYMLHVPASYTASTPAALVISLHGAWLYPGLQKRLTGWNTLADEHGFIVVYPRAQGFPRVWRLAPGPGLDTELRFFRDLIDDLSGRFSIDPARIYVNGYSNGAAMTFMLSCAMGDRIAAFGMVATPVVPWEWCKDRQPVPMLAFHGTADPYAPYDGGENFLTTEPLPSMESWFSTWGERNRCGDISVTTLRVGNVTEHEFRNCARDATARLYTLPGAGHVWPGGRRLPEFGTGPYSAAIHATEKMWAFFAQHPLRID